MSDLVERLRDFAKSASQLHAPIGADIQQAAARIEALERILRAAVKDADWCKEHGDPLPPWNDAAIAALSGATPPDGLVEEDSSPPTLTHP